MTARFGSTLEMGASGRKQAILDAARQRFLHYGYKKTTVDEITTDAGIAKGTMYLYFPSKEAILFTLVREVKRQITQRMREIAAGPSAPPDKLCDMLAARVVAVHEACTGSPHGSEMIEEIRPQLVECGREEHDAQIGLLADVLREGHRQGLFDVADPARAAHLLVAACAAYMPPYLCPAFPTPRTSADLEEGAREMAVFLLRGLRRCR